MKKQKSNLTAQIGISAVLFILIEVIMLLWNGGYLFGSILVGGIFALLGLCITKFNIKMSHAQMMFFVFSLWYLICSAKNGVILEYLIYGCVPMVVFAFWLLSDTFGSLRQKMVDIIVEISMWISVVAVVYCVYMSVDAGYLVRLDFPFDYSNAAGIYFAVCYIRARLSDSVFIKKYRGVFLPAIVLTQSVGAIGIFVVALISCLVCEKKYKSIIFIVICMIVFCFSFGARVIQSSGTFVERLLHINDGIRCVGDNLLFGIGAGNWENAKNYYQTGFYITSKIHSSITNVGVNSGIIGLGLFLAVVICQLKPLYKHKENFIPIIMIVIHSVFDFTLSFVAVDILLVMLALPCEKDNKGLNPLLIKCTSCLVIGFMCFLSVGMWQVAKFHEDIDKDVDVSLCIERFGDSFYLRHSDMANKRLAATMYNKKIHESVDFFDYKYSPVEIILRNSLVGGDKYLIDSLIMQPYNLLLMDYAEQNSQRDIKEETEKIKEKAKKELSFFGEILYSMKGENQ